MCAGKEKKEEILAKVKSEKERNKTRLRRDARLTVYSSVSNAVWCPLSADAARLADVSAAAAADFKSVMIERLVKEGNDDVVAAAACGDHVSIKRGNFAQTPSGAVRNVPIRQVQVAGHSLEALSLLESSFVFFFH